MSEAAAVSARSRLRRLIIMKRREVARLKRDVTQAQVDERQLVRLLEALEREGVSDALIERSTSAKRILIEQLVLVRLSKNKARPTSSEELWPTVAAAGVATRSTFRSMLRRMSQKGMIESAGSGLWILADGMVVNERIDPHTSAAMLALDEKFGWKT